MATFNQLSVLIAEQLKRPLDDTFREMLKDRIKYWRSRLIRNSVDKNALERKFFTQTVTMKLEEVNATECGINLDCKLMRTVNKVPMPTRANGILFDFVGSIEGSNPFKLVTRYELSYLMGDRYAPLVSDFYIYENGYILTNKAPYVMVTGIFDDPEAAIEAGCTSSDNAGTCDTENEDLGVTGDIAQLIVQSILQIDFGQREGDDDVEIEVVKDKQ